MGAFVLTVLLQIGFSMFAGLAMSRLAKLIKLPAVTAYLVAGLLIGPFLLGQMFPMGLGFQSLEQIDALGILCDVALGFIAFSIGDEFRLAQLKRTGRKAAVIALIQALAATAAVDIALLLLHLAIPEKLPVSACITLGAIAAATAPAATLMVINQYKAKGPVTELLLPIVALDDAIGLVVFAVSIGIARTLEGGSALNAVTLLLNPLLEIVGSLALGGLMGLLLTFCERFFHSRSKRMSISITFLLITVALSKLKIAFPGSSVQFGFSPLLSCMMLATVFCNICDYSEDMMAKVDRWTAPLYILFFVLSGAELNLRVFSDSAVICVGLIYILARSAGKIFGSAGASRLMKCEPKVQKYLGPTLLPQAGVALGMTVTVAEQLPGSGTMIRSIVLFSVLIYELVGPMITKIALTRAGDIHPELRRSNRGVVTT